MTPVAFPANDLPSPLRGGKGLVLGVQEIMYSDFNILNFLDPI
jgi:hypothetical protein